MNASCPCHKCYRRLYEGEVRYYIEYSQPTPRRRNGHGYSKEPPLRSDGGIVWGHYMHPWEDGADALDRYCRRYGYSTLQVMQPDGTFREVAPRWPRDDQ